jgi:hypothetical protein
LIFLQILFLSQVQGTSSDDNKNNLLIAIDLDPQNLVSGSLNTSEVGVAIIEGRRGFLFPIKGTSFLMMSNGGAEAKQYPDGWMGQDNETLSISNNNPTGTCPLGGNAYDLTTLSFSLKVPDEANSFSFNFRFMSEEYPDYVGQEYNDFFSCLLNGQNIVFDTKNNIINVNNNFFDSSIIPEGSVFNGATILLTAKAEVEGGSIIDLDFIVGDVGDDILDSAVFIDNFQFSGDEVIGIETVPASLDTKDSLREARSLSVVGAVGVGVTAATVLLVSLGPTINAAISSLPIPSQLRSFLKFYGANIFQKVDKVKLEILEKKSFISKEELIALAISISIVTLVYSFVEANGLNQFLNPSVLAVVIPSTFVSVSIITCTKVFSDAYCARTCKAFREFNLWITGLITFIISGILFLFPFSSPGITRYQSGGISQRTKGLLILSKILILLTLTIPFYILFAIGYRIIGDSGLLLTLMSACYSLIPMKYLSGKVVYDFNKKYSILAFVITTFLFISFTIKLLPIEVYIPVGIISAYIATRTLRELKTSIIEQI